MTTSSSRRPRWGIKAAFPPFAPTMTPQMQHPAFSALPRSFWMSGGLFNHKPRPRMQYSADQISAAIEDVEMGKSISKAAKDNGVPFTSLYRKVKALSSSQHSEESPRVSTAEESESVPSLDALSADIAFLSDQKSLLEEVTGADSGTQSGADLGSS